MAEPGSSEQAEAAAIRRRWITLGELLAVAAVVISGLTFWNSYQDRTGAEAERAAEKREQAAARAASSAKAQRVTLRASGGGARLTLAPADPRQIVQEQAILFPSPFGRSAIETVEPRIEAGWIESAAERARGQAGSASGDRRLPIAITTRFVVGDETHSDTAIYDVGYRLDEGLIDTDAELLGLSLVERVTPGEAQRRLDAVWARRVANKS